MARKPNRPDDQPVLVIGAEIRLYRWEPELIDYFRQFKPGQYATAIKRAVRAALGGGHLALNVPLPGAPQEAEGDPDDLDGFVG